MARTSPSPSPADPPPTPLVSLESTQALLDRARSGDCTAKDVLAERYLTALRRFAHGRIPSRARAMVDTDDLVQMAVVRTLNHIDTFQPERQGSLLAYLRSVVLNLVRDEIRRSGRRPPHQELDEQVPAAGLDPLEELISRESVERYEAALACLPSDQQEAFMLRIEMGYSFREIAESLGRATPDAARMLVRRALKRLVDELQRPARDE